MRYAVLWLALVLAGCGGHGPKPPSANNAPTSSPANGNAPAAVNRKARDDTKRVLGQAACDLYMRGGVSLLRKLSPDLADHYRDTVLAGNSWYDVPEAQAALDKFGVQFEDWLDRTGKDMTASVRQEKLNEYAGKVCFAVEDLIYAKEGIK